MRLIIESPCRSVSLTELGKAERPPGVARKLKKFLQRDAVFKVEGDQVSLA